MHPQHTPDPRAAARSALIRMLAERLVREALAGAGQVAQDASPAGDRRQ